MHPHHSLCTLVDHRALRVLRGFTIGPLGMRGSACVEVMTTLHGSAPSLRRRAEGVYRGGTSLSMVGPLIHLDALLVPVQTILSSIHPRAISLFRSSRFIDRTFVPRLDIPLWIRAEEEFQIHQIWIRGRYGRPVHAAMASIQEALVSLRQEIGGQQGRPPAVQDETRMTHIHLCHPYPFLSASGITICITRMRVSDGSTVWDDFEGMPVASLPAKYYSIPAISEWGSPAWFASLEFSRRRTWDDLAQEFLRQFSFNTVVDVSRRELEALRQRERSNTDGFEEPTARIARHVVGIPFADFGHWLWLIYDVEDNILREIDRCECHQFLQSEASQASSACPTASRGSSFLYASAVQATGTSPTFDQTYQPQPLLCLNYATQSIERPPISIQPLDSHAMLHSSLRYPLLLTQAQSSADLCSIYFEDAETVLPDRHAVDQ
ncbi:hypothetical protein CK203_116412 [Vitis vinifera]|uniref:Retrotransposon gag domain-containing protein n=1 Tax=Vitis vinifera TaxID=29760 RepID=A0A438CAT0_VITVI|nr:hypothetical protein CK203_116412 [Vitis vinifera]